MLDWWNNKVKCVAIEQRDEHGMPLRVGDARVFETDARGYVTGLCALDDRTLIVVEHNETVVFFDTVSSTRLRGVRLPKALVNSTMPRRRAFPCATDAHRVVVAFEYADTLIELRTTRERADWRVARTFTLPRGIETRCLHFDVESRRFALGTRCDRDAIALQKSQESLADSQAERARFTSDTPHRVAILDERLSTVCTLLIDVERDDYVVSCVLRGDLCLVGMVCRLRMVVRLAQFDVATRVGPRRLVRNYSALVDRRTERG